MAAHSGGRGKKGPKRNPRRRGQRPKKKSTAGARPARPQRKATTTRRARGVAAKHSVRAQPRRGGAGIPATLFELPGSRRPLPPTAQSLGPLGGRGRIEVTVLLRRGSEPADFPDLEAAGAQPARDRVHLTRQEFAARHGASPGDLTLVRDFAARQNLRVEAEHAARRSVVLSGTALALGRAFGVRLERFQDHGREFRSHATPLRIPASLAGSVIGVFGLDDRPQARPHFRRPAVAADGYTPLQVAALYQFPPGLDGSGRRIGILELGGGYNPADLSAFFTGLGLALPAVTAVGVDGASNQPTGDANGPDAEVELDIEIAGAIAPAARIAVYFAPNTSRGFLDALTTAVHDTVNQPEVISISWGEAEAGWDQQSLDALNAACQDAAALGITICVAAGDGGSSDGVSDGQPHVDFPASSPYVLACGGTRLTAAAGQIASEVVWDDLPSGGATGGGISGIFPLPKWQTAAGVPPDPAGHPGRGVPDVAGDADPATGYRTIVDGQSGVIGGTSAVAPLWAGLLARLNQRLGHPIGFLNPLLYAQLPHDILRDITQGANGAYRAGPGWDPCTGLGSPNGAQLDADLG